MSAKIVICVEAIIYLLLHNLHDFTIKDLFSSAISGFSLQCTHLLLNFPSLQVVRGLSLALPPAR